MQTTAEKEVKAKADQKVFDKDKKRAEELMKAYSQLNADKEKIETERDKEITPIQEKFQDRLSPIIASMNEAEAELSAIGKRHKKRFVKNRLPLEHGYLLLSLKAFVKTKKDFVMSKFLAKFPQLVSVEFNIAELKKVFTDGDARKEVTKHFDIDLKNEETIQIKLPKKEVEK